MGSFSGDPQFDGQDMKERPKLEWVRSHQDDNPDVDITKLSDATQLNIKADALATQGLDRLNSKPK